MDNIFIDIMKSKTDEELVEITTLHRHQYVTEAMRAAEQEIQERNLNIPDIENNIRRINEEKKQRIPFNKKYLSSAIIILMPLLLLVISFYSEHVFGIFLLPVALLLTLPSGIIGYQLARKEHGKTAMNDSGINHVVGFFQILFSIFLIIVGAFGILFFLAFIIQ